MEMVKPKAGKSTISRTTGTLEIIMPSKKNIFIILFLPFWLAGWAYALVAVGKNIIAPNQGTTFFAIFWLGGWIVGGGFALVVWLWSIMGKEIVSVNSSFMKIRKGIGSLLLSKTYNIQDIKNIRIVESSGSFQRSPFDDLISFRKIGTIAFDYGMNTFRFASGIDEAEAKHIIETLRQEGYFRS
jgi:hypothetical protein